MHDCLKFDDQHKLECGAGTDEEPSRELKTAMSAFLALVGRGTGLADTAVHRAGAAGHRRALLLVGTVRELPRALTAE